MANYSTLKASVNAYIKANGVRAITGPVLNGILTQMINTLGDGARYGGIATPSGNPGTHDNVVFYLAFTAGTYTNYGGVTLDGSTLHVFVYDGTWADVDTGVPTSTAFATKADKDEDAVEGNIAKFDANGNPVDAGIAAEKINQLDQKFVIENDVQISIQEDHYCQTTGITIGSTYTGVDKTLSGYGCVIGLPVSNGDIFDFYGIGSANNAFKCYVITDSEDKVIEIYPLTGNIDYRQSPYRITIPQNGANLYVNFASTYNSETDKLIKRVSEVIDLPLLKESTDDNSNAIAKLESELTLKGKKIVCFGDSITEFKDNAGLGKSYPDYLRDISGADVVNVGIGGTRLSQRTTVVTTPTTTKEAYAALDIVSMVDASCNQQFTAQVNAAQYLKDNTGDDNTAIVARLQAIDWSNVDIVTILGGTNDWASSVPLGTSGSFDKSTIYGAINTIFRDITYKYPKIKVFYFCPPIRIIPTSNFQGGFNSARTYNINEEVLYQHALYRFVNSHTGLWDANDVTLVPASDLYAQSSDVQTYGDVTLESLSQSILQEVRKNHIPICDIYHELWTPYNFTNACNSDLIHPLNGLAQIAAKINSFILSNKSFV